jgi:hypothetical protein
LFQENTMVRRASTTGIDRPELIERIRGLEDENEALNNNLDTISELAADDGEDDDDEEVENDEDDDEEVENDEVDDEDEDDEDEDQEDE